MTYKAKARSCARAARAWLFSLPRHATRGREGRLLIRRYRYLMAQ